MRSDGCLGWGTGATQILLRQAPQAIDAVVEAFDLTDGERAFLLSAGRGDALLACGTARVAFHSLASDIEADHVVTGPEFRSKCGRPGWNSGAAGP
jgi:hypothetical protein